MSILYMGYFLCVAKMVVSQQLKFSIFIVMSYIVSTQTCVSKRACLKILFNSVGDNFP